MAAKHLQDRIKRLEAKANIRQAPAPEFVKVGSREEADNLPPVPEGGFRFVMVKAKNKPKPQVDVVSDTDWQQAAADFAEQELDREIAEVEAKLKEFPMPNNKLLRLERRLAELTKRRNAK